MRARHQPDRGGDMRALDVRQPGASIAHRDQPPRQAMLDLSDPDEDLAELNRLDQRIVGEPARNEPLRRARLRTTRLMAFSGRSSS